MRKIKQFFINAVILTATSILLRAMVVFFGVYISGKVGASGMGLYQLILSVYTLAITFASSGIGLAATRLVSEELAHGAELGARRAMRRCLIYSLCFGTAAALVLFCSAPFIGIRWLQDVRSIKSLYLLSVSLPFIAMSSSMSGYFTAVRRVSKSASAQIFEQLIRMGLGSYLLTLLLPKGVEYACMAVVIGGSAAELLSFLYLYILYVQDMRRHQNSKTAGEKLTRRMIRIALPVALSSYIRTGLTTITQMLVPSGLRKSGASSEGALAQYGVIRGMVLPVVLFPQAFLQAFSSLLVPEMAECNTRGDTRRINAVSARVIQITLLFSVGVAGVLTGFSGELGQVLYRNRDVSVFIKTLAPLVTVMYLDSAVDGILKGLDQQVNVMRYNIIDAVVSLILTWTLLPRYGAMGYMAVIFISEILNLALSMGRLLKVTDFKILIFSWIILPALAATGAVATVRILSRALWAGHSTQTTLVLSVVITTALYLALLLSFRCITKRDLTLLRAVFVPQSPTCQRGRNG